MIARACIVATALISAALPQVAPFKLSDVMAPVPAPAKFADGWSATESGITIHIIQAHTGPRCRAEHNCPWLVEWSGPKGDRAEVMVDAGSAGQSVSYVPADAKQRAKMGRHRITFDPAAVRYIRIVVRKGSDRKEREIARATFR